MPKTTKSQQKPSELLRERIKLSGVPLARIARESGIKYPRFYDIAREGIVPTVDEYSQIQNALDMFASQISQMQSNETKQAVA